MPVACGTNKKEGEASEWAMWAGPPGVQCKRRRCMRVARVQGSRKVQSVCEKDPSKKGQVHVVGESALGGNTLISHTH